MNGCECGDYCGWCVPEMCTPPTFNRYDKVIMTGATGHDANLVGTDADQAVTAALMPVRSSADDEFWTAKWDAAKTQEVAA